MIREYTSSGDTIGVNSEQSELIISETMINKSVFLVVPYECY